MLKEQDGLIEMIRGWIIHPEEEAGLDLSVIEVFELVEQMIREQVEKPNASTRLVKYLPKPPKFFKVLSLVEAVKEYDKRYRLLHRRYIPPTFKEIRHILNLASIKAIASTIHLVTFDADDTIYADGGSITKESPMANIIIELLRSWIAQANMPLVRRMTSAPHWR